MQKNILTIILGLFIVFFLSCEFGPAGPAGLDGTDGSNSKLVPGGYISMELVVGSLPLSASAVSVAFVFDDDEICCEGDELYVNVDFTAFLTASNEVGHSLTWNAPNVPPGAKQ